MIFCNNLVVLTVLACIALLWRNHNTPVDIAPTIKEAKAIATATSTGTSTSVWLVCVLKSCSWVWPPASRFSISTGFSSVFLGTGRMCSGPRTVICWRLDSLCWWFSAQSSLGSTHRLMLPLAPALVAEHKPIRHWIQILLFATKSFVIYGEKCF